MFSPASGVGRLGPFETDAPAAFHAGAELRIDGGMSRSAWFSQRLADLTGVAVQRATYEEATALGAALFAGLGCGLYADLAEAASAHLKTEAFDPAMAPEARAARYGRWLDVIGRLRSED